MANTISTSFKVNGSSKFTYEVQIQGDGSGDETNTVILDPANLTGAPSDFKIRAIQWGLGGFKAALLWDATTPKLAYQCPEYDGFIRFADTGAHKINDAGVGKTGKLLLTTQGLNFAGFGTLIIEGQHT